MKSVAIALCAIAGLAMASAPDAYAQKSKKKKVTAAAPAAAKQWTDCSKLDPAKRDVCIRNLPTVKGPVPIGGAAAVAAAAPAAAAKDAKPAAAAGGVPCAGVEPAKRDACLSRAPAVKGPGWADFAARSASKKK